MYGYIYKFTMVPTGKIYVGKRTKPEFDPGYFGSGKKWRPALRYYGKENVKREILEWCNDKEELEEREEYWIDKLNSTNPTIGYNISIKSGNFCGVGENNPSTGKHWWTNGVRQLFQRECPGEGWYRGCLNSKNKIGKKVYNNGEYDVYSDSCPDGFVEGSLRTFSQPEKSKKKIGNGSRGRKWYTNGIINKRVYSCPDGFHEGVTVSEEGKINRDKGLEIGRKRLYKNK